MESRQDIEIIRKRVYDTNEHFREGKFEILKRLEGDCILVKDSYGESKCFLSALLKGSLPSIRTAIDKKEYFSNKLKEVNPKIYNIVEVVDYISNSKVILNSKYGYFEVDAPGLLKWTDLSIKSAKDKTFFWIERCRDIRDDFDKIDYSEVVFENISKKVKLTCKEHNITYEQRPSHHTSGTQGCPLCMTQTIKYTEENFKKHYEFLKEKDGILYVIKLKDENEEFYKVGITQRHRVQYRFNSISGKYKVEVIYTENMSLIEAFENEQLFLRDFKEYSYKPNKHFTGHTECLTVNPLEYYYYYFKQNNTIENE